MFFVLNVRDWVVLMQLHTENVLDMFYLPKRKLLGSRNKTQTSQRKLLFFHDIGLVALTSRFVGCLFVKFRYL